MAHTLRNLAISYDPADPGVTDWLTELRDVMARLPKSCRLQDTTYALDPATVVDHKEISRFFRDEPSIDVDIMSRTIGQVMDALFRDDWPAGVTVRFYCREFGHPRGICSCEYLLHPRSLAASPHYRSLKYNLVFEGWVIDRADLVALTDEIIAAQPYHPETRRKILLLVHHMKAAAAAA